MYSYLRLLRRLINDTTIGRFITRYILSAVILFKLILDKFFKTTSLKYDLHSTLMKNICTTFKDEVENTPKKSLTSPQYNNIMTMLYN